MKVIMLAAGLGSRLGQTSAEIGPKVLMQFGGKSLLERHIDIFKAQGISELVLGVGFQHDKIQHEIERLEAESLIRTLKRGISLRCHYFAMSSVAASPLF
jgi:choline kinase